MDKLFVVVFRVLLCLIQAMVMLVNDYPNEEIKDKLSEAHSIMMPYITPIN